MATALGNFPDSIAVCGKFPLLYEFCPINPQEAAKSQPSGLSHGVLRSSEWPENLSSELAIRRLDITSPRNELTNRVQNADFGGVTIN